MTIRAKQVERLGNGVSSTTPVAVASYNILQTDVNLLVNTSAAARTLVLPAPSSRWSGFVWDVGGAALINNITL